MVDNQKNGGSPASKIARDASLQDRTGIRSPPSKAFGRAASIDHLKCQPVVPADLRGKIDDAGNTAVEMDPRGRVEPRFCQNLCKCMRNALSPSERIDAAKAAKAALEMNDRIDKTDAESILCSFASCLDEGDMQLRLTAILGLYAHASLGGEIKDHLEVLAKRLDDIAPINRKAALLAFEAYALQGESQAESALGFASNSRNKDAAVAIIPLCGKGFDFSMEQRSDEILTLVHSLGEESEESIQAFMKLHECAIGNSENAFEILILLEAYRIDDPLVKELKEACLAITKDAEKGKSQGGSLAGTKT